jgi:hypothetical protein
LISPELEPNFCFSLLHSKFDHGQVTKLRDGVVIGFTINHAVVDGTSLWHFINSMGGSLQRHGHNLSPASSQPVFRHKRLPHSSQPAPNPNDRQVLPACAERKNISLQQGDDLEAKGQSQQGRIQRPNYNLLVPGTLCPHMAGHHTGSRAAPHEPTTFKLAVNCRPRLIPPLPYSYFGNAIQVVSTKVTAGELLACDIFSAAGLLHRIIWPHRDANIRAELQSYNAAPLYSRWIEQFAITV